MMRWRDSRKSSQMVQYAMQSQASKFSQSSVSTKCRLKVQLMAEGSKWRSSRVQKEKEEKEEKEERKVSFRKKISANQMQGKKTCEKTATPDLNSIAVTSKASLSESVRKRQRDGEIRESVESVGFFGVVRAAHDRGKKPPHLCTPLPHKQTHTTRARLPEKMKMKKMKKMKNKNF